MLSKRVASFAVLFAAGAVFLSACGDTESTAIPGGNGAVSTEASEIANAQFVNGTAKSNNAEPGTGDWAVDSGDTSAGTGQGQSSSNSSAKAQKWVQLTAGAAGALDPVVVNGAGRTLYRFDKDSNKPAKSNCNGDCAVTWPPVLVAPGGKIFVDGVKKSSVGLVKRDDGNYQVTINGWPVYRFSKDTKAGDTKGQGVGGTWFGVTPEGGKAGQPAGTPTTAPTTSSSQASNTSVVLFDDANFSDNGASQGLAGSGCQNVARAKVASSIQVTGGPVKIWSGKDCTGKSSVVTGEVTDLGTLGLDNAVSSIFLG